MVVRAREAGIDTDRVLRSVDLVEAELEAEFDPERLWRAYDRLGRELRMTLARARGTRPFDETDRAILIHYLVGADNLREALERFVAFVSSHRERMGLEYSIEHLPGTVVLRGHHYTTPMDDITISSVLRSLNSFLYLMSWLGAVRVAPTRIVLPGVPADDIPLPVWAVDAPITHGADHSEVWFAAPLLERPVVRDLADATVFLNCIGDVALGLSIQLSMADLASEMIERHCQSTGKMLTLQQLAVVLNTSETTLRRRLREKGDDGFAILRQRCQMRLAKHFLVSTEWTVDDVAARVGFQDGNAFRRSFKRWTGTSPSMYRRATNPPDATR